MLFLGLLFNFILPTDDLGCFSQLQMVNLLKQNKKNLALDYKIFIFYNKLL